MAMGYVSQEVAPIGPFSRGWSITSEPLAASRLKRLPKYACLRVDIKLHGCTPHGVYTAGINVYDADEPAFGGIPRFAFHPGPQTIDGVSRQQVNEYILLTKRAKETGYVAFRRLVPARHGTYDVQVWIAKGAPDGDQPLQVCYKAGETFGDSQKITIQGDAFDFRTRDQSNRMLLSRPTSVQSYVLLRDGVWEPVTTALVNDQVKEGDTVLDIGAHIGYYTLMFAKLVGASGRVFAFEPDPTNFALLQENVRLNGYTNVTLEQRAVADVSGTVSLFLDGSEDGGHSMVVSGGERRKIDVEAVRLDDYFDGYRGKVDFVKLDIEGAEPMAIRGMSRLLEQHPRVKLIAEFLPTALQRIDGGTAGYLELLRDYGFDPVYHLIDHENRIESVDVARISRVFSPEHNLATNFFWVKGTDGVDATRYGLRPQVADATPNEKGTRWHPSSAAASASDELLPRDLRNYEARKYSQDGEDGIIEEVCRRIGLTRGTFVEFGAETGSECNCAYLGRERGWNGFFIEADAGLFQQLEENYRNYPGVKCASGHVTSANVQSLFADMGVPRDFDLLSVDIDGNDYWVWRAIRSFFPAVVVIEYNASYPPPTRWVMAENDSHVWDGSSYFGASLASLAALGEEKGYRLIGTTSNGVNAFFLRNDLVRDDLFVAGSVEYHYSFPTYGPTQAVIRIAPVRT